MGFMVLAWIFVLAVAIHNAEEAIWLPAWSKTAGRWHRPIGKSEFRFAVGALTILAAGVTALAELQGKLSLGAYLLCGYALAMLLNVVVPHVFATLAMSRYAPGTATAVLINLPVTALLLRTALADGYVDGSQFIWVGPLVVLGLIASIPLLFWAGRMIMGTR
jgi:hypothetical protein